MIPTAEEFLKREEELITNIIDGGQSYSMALNHFSVQLIEFAKLHVKAALKAAAKTSKEGYNTIAEKQRKEAILNAYPLDKIV